MIDYDQRGWWAPKELDVDALSFDLSGRVLFDIK